MKVSEITKFKRKFDYINAKVLWKPKLRSLHVTRYVTSLKHNHSTALAGARHAPPHTHWINTHLQTGQQGLTPLSSLLLKLVSVFSANYCHFTSSLSK